MVVANANYASDVGTYGEIDALVIKAQAGDVAALQTVWQFYQPLITKIAVRLKYDELEDVMQDIYIQFHKGLPKLQSPRAMVSWLRHLVRNFCSWGIRKQKRLVTITLTDACECRLEKNHQCIDADDFEFADEAQALTKYFREIDPSYGTVFQMHFLEKKKTAAICSRLGWNVYRTTKVVREIKAYLLERYE